MRQRLTYKNAGVDIREGDEFIRLIKPLARATYTKGVISGVGGFGASFEGRFEGMKDPVLVSSTDGVGTKLKIAFMADRHDTVGIDLVAMCVNDVATTGARPLFFLDYFAAGRLDKERASEVIKGIAKGCKEAGCALVGGETAEMPGIYKGGEYDLAGFTVGVVEKKKIIDGSKIKPGDKIIGLASSGLHSNGYSLARKLFFETLGHKLTDRPIGFKKTLGKELLTPTRIYVKTILAIAKHFEVKGRAHITGGGLTGNIPRCLPEGVKAVIREGSWTVPLIFRYIRDAGSVADTEMRRTFNLGIGMVMVVSRGAEAGIIKKLRSLDERPYSIGVVEKKRRTEEPVEFRKQERW
ncbi:MAG: phosphoribosylformylglycinamidine cyclo-ligase [Deltaproteobacteria bacterium]|nr:phosphoribosylformylglycinamidine cyclo-ligase [Deltaproteobacteria bacterium]